eukprot:scaffold1697_cov120-Cylindrotheca_fusiformis.AAC.39
MLAKLQDKGCRYPNHDQFGCPIHVDNKQDILYPSYWRKQIGSLLRRSHADAKSVCLTLSWYIIMHFDPSSLCATTTKRSSQG